LTSTAAGQRTPSQVLTDADYRHAEQFMPYNTAKLVFGAVDQLTWLPDDRFWYRTMTPDGFQVILVDPARKTHVAAFDAAQVAAALSNATGTAYSAANLPSMDFDYSPDAKTASFAIKGRTWKCDLPANTCSDATVAASAAKDEVVSPDGKRAVFIRNWNLWLRDKSSGKETPLTTDGVKDFGYATDNAGWRQSSAPIVLWSPDSRKVATFQQDQRGVGEMYLVNTKVGHPELRAWKYPLPGDATVTTIQRVVVDVDAARVVRFKMDPDQHRSTTCDDIACKGVWGDVQWSADSSRVAFISTARDHRQEWLRVADAGTGDVREVLHETVPTFYESGNGRANWKYLPESNEVIWFSERDNWGQLYLYNLGTGQLKNQITTGEGNVAQMLYVDEKSRTIIFSGNGKEKSGDPYFLHLYRVGFDGKNQALLTPEDANHDLSISPSGRYIADSYSTPETPAVSVVRVADGSVEDTFSRTDISKLIAGGWVPPVSFTVKARDGATDLYGLLFKPSKFDPAKKYPIINRIYPGPQTGSVGNRSFAASRGDAQALAELGFVVVLIDGTGTPWRSKKFHEAYYGNLGDNTLPDQVSGMKQLAQRYPWIDLDRAGIYGHSGGGFATADAMFRYPDFFKVGIAESGNHDNREYEDDWAEKWDGLLEKRPDGTSSYDGQDNQSIAKELKGHLLLAHGTMDDNVPPYNTLLVVDALIRANKDFDLLLLPNRPHGYGSENGYMTRRRWDYFVRYLMDAQPPFEYQMHPPD
jgi:dipeptidyl-peptidase 4